MNTAIDSSIRDENTPDSPLTAIGFLFASTVLLSAQDALIKQVAEYLSFWQIQTFRLLMNVGFFLLVLAVQ